MQLRSSVRVAAPVALAAIVAVGVVAIDHPAAPSRSDDHRPLTELVGHELTPATDQPVDASLRRQPGPPAVAADVLETPINEADPFPASDVEPGAPECDPSEGTDPRCIATWAAFHIAQSRPDDLDPLTTHPDLLATLNQITNPANPRDLDVELVVVDGLGAPDRVGPGQADIEIVIERNYPTGELDHLWFAATLTKRPAGTWELVTLEPVR